MQLASPKPILLVHQVSTGHSGRLGEKLRVRGHELVSCCPVAGEPLPRGMDDYAGVVIFGGPMSANDDAALPGLRAQLDWILTVLAADTPFLGICLGAQLLARTLGARVAPHPDGWAEIGYFPVQPTVAGAELFAPALHVYHWHREGFEVPSGTVLLASGERFPNQAFRYGKNAYGIQFHPEVTAVMMEEWLQQAAERLRLRGAQSAAQQRLGRARFDAAFIRWLDQFLDHWLGDG